MGMVRIEKGKHLIHKDDAQEKLEIILQGRVNMIVGDEVIPLDTGTIIGIAACEKQRYCCDYIAAEDTVLMEYPYKQVADLEKLFAEQPKYATVFPMAAVKQANTVLNYYGKRTELAKKLYSMGVGMYRDYKYLCSEYELYIRRVETGIFSGISRKRYAECQCFFRHGFCSWNRNDALCRQGDQ